ncbi:U3 small nucleolar ribonucleoprotein IMP4 [Tripterygium wilfordii]|uniref:U3 small nucleolar ribonucleoprotein IMP4 n=1 Tax=Tripterygium wilfordii TaxID=458696 RepID=A0A7J7C5B1_TRIWF|nr:U3 small nucleolar ribonucleoprotein IMP4 [Tripterygium wilfordii]
MSLPLQELKFVLPNAQRMNRGSQVVSEIINECRTRDFTDVVLVHEHRGVPDGLIISHLPFGPTAYFGLLNVVTRHDIKDKKSIGTMPEAYPHLSLNNFSTQLGEMTANILKHLFPVPKPDTKRIVTFANQSDYISFRNHIYEKHGGPKSIELKEIGPRFELRLYQMKLGTVDQSEAQIEWVIRPYMNTTKKRKLLGKVALVTGGASGIGEAIVRLFHKHGAKVCIVDVQDKLGQQVCQSLGGEPNTAYLHCDVSIEDDIRRAVDFTVDKFTTLDIMVNNAGVIEQLTPDICDFDLSMFDKTLSQPNDLYIYVPLEDDIRSAIGFTVENFSTFDVMVNNEILGVGPHAYTASKHAILGLTKKVAAELGKYGVMTPVAERTFQVRMDLQVFEVSWGRLVLQGVELSGVSLMVDGV